MAEAVPTCATCRHCFTSMYAATHGQRTCNRRTRFSSVNGTVTVGRPAEYERSRFWRMLGANICGPEGCYWSKELPPLPPSIRPSR